MGVLRDRSTIIAALLLATLAFAGFGDSHRHDSLTTPAGHQDLPTFSAGHDQPDRTVHVEGATRIEQASCVVCLLQRQRVDGTPATVLAGVEQDSSPLAVESASRLVAHARRLKPSRAPPRA